MKICWRGIFFICKKTRSSSSKQLTILHIYTDVRLQWHLHFYPYPSITTVDGMELLEFSSRALSCGDSMLNIVLEVVSLQRRKVQEKFIKLLEPYFDTAHVCTLSTLLRRGDDWRVFTFLPILMKVLRREQWDGLMKTAILSPYLDRENELRNRLKVLEALEYCICYSVFKYSDAMGRQMARLIQSLYIAEDEAERRYAGRLCAAIASACFPRRWRIGYWGV